ncbi:MAG: YfcC family protein [Clostridia bacterium]|nr:YfcC family protein [Clostridia bacterium]
METNVHTEEKQRKREKAVSNIETKSFLVIVVLLTVMIILSGVLSYIIPQGAYARTETDLIIPDSFILGEVKGIAIWRILTAPFRVYVSEDALTIIMISVFLLVMSGVFNLMDKTGGIRIFIGKTMRKFSSKGKLVVCITTLVFMLFGSFFGLFEELVTLLPIVIMFMLSLGFDTMTGLGVCMMSACFGFSAAITNPFSVGLIPEMATDSGLSFSVTDGLWLRILFFAFVFAAVCGFLLLHIRRITKNPQKSLSYTIDLKKRESLQTQLSSQPMEEAKERRIFKVFAIFFSVQFVLLILIASIRAISGYAIPILAVSFLVGGIVCGLLVCDKKSAAFRYLGKGALSMLPAVALIALASSVKLVMVEGGIMDTVMYYVTEYLKDKNPYTCVILLYFLILLLQVFIGSASAKIFLIMPIILPIAASLGISPTVVALTYCIADGFTDMILPTNPVLLIGLSIAGVSYGKWVKWTWLMQLFLFVCTVLILLLAVAIGY